MRTAVSRLLLVGLVIALITFVIVRADSGSNALVFIDGIKAEGDPSHRAFEVIEPMHVAVEAAGSFEGGEADTVLAAHGWLVHRETGRVVWRMRPARRPERGTFVLLRDTLRLAPGVYDAHYAALGDPIARATHRPGESLGARVRDALSSGGKGWVGDAARWRFSVTGATAADRNRAVRLRDDDPEDEDAIWSTGPARSDRIYEAALRATAPVRVRVDALFEVSGQAVADSAYLVSADGDVVWSATAEASRWAGGSPVNRRQTETVALAPGLYRAVYHADRSHAHRDWTANPPWEPWRWGLRISPADSASRAGALEVVDPLSDLPRIAEIECVGGDEERLAHFEVLRPLEVTLVAVGEIVGRSGYDYATLSRDGRVIWDMREARLRPAGGDRNNRRADHTMRLERGTYTLRYTTDNLHHCGAFGGDGPDDEDFWGAVVLSTDGREAEGRVRTLTALPRPGGAPGALVDLTRVESDRDVSSTFELAEPTDVCVMAVGEMRPDARYDWSRLDGPTRWEMTYGQSLPAGGDARNRVVIDRITLQPGRYTAHALTDDSHAWDDWNGPTPDHPEAWGLQVWPAPETRDPLDPRRDCLLPGVSLPSDPTEMAPTAPPPAPLPPPEPAPDEPEIFEVVERAPVLVGGIDGLQARAAYPEAARRAGIEGKVFVQFVVTASGRVQRATCVRSPDDRLCDAAVRAVEASRFEPGTQRGRPVDVRFTLPVDFRLR